MNDQTHPKTSRDPDRHSRDWNAPGDRLHGRNRGAGRPLLGGADAAQPWSISRLATTVCRSVFIMPMAMSRKRRHWSMPAAGRLPAWKADAIVRAADEAIEGKLDDHFPLYVWQTGSGHTIQYERQRGVVEPGDPAARRRDRQQSAGAPPTTTSNMGQSSNDTFPTAMHIAAVMELEEHLLPHAEALAAAIEAKANEWMDIVKTGRTHLMDAVPLTVGQEWSGWGAPDPRCAGPHPGVAVGPLRAGGGRQQRSEPGSMHPCTSAERLLKRSPS